MMKRLITLTLLVVFAGISFGRAPTAGNMFNVSDYSGTYGLEVNTDGSVVPMTTSNALGNASYPWTNATVTTLGATTGNITTVNAAAVTNSGNSSVTTVNGRCIYQIIIATNVVDTCAIPLTAVNGKVGWGNISVSSATAGAQFTFTAGGQVNISISSGTTTTAANDGTLNIYDAASGIVLENQLGATRNIVGVIYYIN